MDEMIDAKIKWFFSKMSYFKDFSPSDGAEIREYIVREKMDAKTIEDLWYVLVANYKYKSVPSIGAINEIYSDHIKSSNRFRSTTDKYTDMIRHNNGVAESWKKMSAKEILHVIKVIREKPIEEWSFTDKQFWNEYDLLWWEFKACKDRRLNPEDMKEHLVYALERIRAKEWFKSMVEREVNLNISNERTGITTFDKAIKAGSQ